MAKLANRAWMLTATAGIGTITLGSSVSGYQSFANAGISNGDVIRYVITEGSNWEIGYGTYSSSGPTLTRNVLASSNSGSPISLNGIASVFIPATDAEFGNRPDQTITASGTVTVNPGDRLILLNKAVQSNTPFDLPTLASRNYAPLTIIDYPGTAGDLGFNPSGTEKIHTLSSFTTTSTGPGYPFKVVLRPFTGVGWAIE